MDTVLDESGEADPAQLMPVTMTHVCVQHADVGQGIGAAGDNVTSAPKLMATVGDQLGDVSNYTHIPSGVLPPWPTCVVIFVRYQMRAELQNSGRLTKSHGIT